MIDGSGSARASEYLVNDTLMGIRLDRVFAESLLEQEEAAVDGEGVKHVVVLIKV